MSNPHFQKANGGTCGTCKRDRRFCAECKRGWYKLVSRENRLAWKRKERIGLTVDSTVISTVVSKVVPTVIQTISYS